MAGLSDAAMVIGATAIRGALGGAQLHIDDPGTGGVAHKSSASMVAPTWTNPTGSGNFDLAAPIAFSGGTPNGPVKYVSLWSNTSGTGVWYGNFLLTGDLVFDANGEYTVESLTITGSAS